METVPTKIETGQPFGLYDLLVELQTEITALKAVDTALVGVCGATITVGAANTATVTAAIQLTDYNGDAIAYAGTVMAYLSDDAAGLEPSGTSPTTDMANGTDGDCQIVVAEHTYMLTSEADGDIDLTLGYTTNAHDFFLVVVLPNGKRIVSTKWEFTA